VTTPSLGLFTYSTLPRGSVVHTAYLADALHDAGWDVTVYALDKDRRGFFRPLRARLRLVPASPTPTTTAELVRVRAAELAGYVRRSCDRHTIHHAQDCLTANGLLELRATGWEGDVVRTVHHVEAFDDPYLARCQERSIREPRMCMAVSEAARKDVRRAFGVRAVVTGNGVCLQRFARVPPPVGGARPPARSGADGPVLLAVGGVEERKNTIRIVGAFTRVRARYPRARLWILGGATVLDHGAYRASFDQVLAGLAPESRAAVTELGVVDDGEVPAIFRAASVIVFPSLHEGFGLTALEGLAAGVPVVASRVAPLTEFLDDSCATLVDPRSEDDIARGIMSALAAGDARREAGLTRAAAYSWQRVAARHVDAYGNLARRPGDGG
jgi:glycosyltransferase-like protein